jgi:hypothetical protein
MPPDSRGPGEFVQCEAMFPVMDAENLRHLGRCSADRFALTHSLKTRTIEVKDACARRGGEQCSASRDRAGPELSWIFLSVKDLFTFDGASEQMP